MFFSPLYVTWDVSPFIFTIGSFGIRWYSLLFVAGFVLGYYIVRRMFVKEGLPADKLMDPLLYTLVISTLIGSRLGHCFFYDPDYYLGSWEGFKEIFMPWKGGLASHGGTIGVMLGLWWYAEHYGKKYGFTLMWLFDRVVIPICFAGAFIRLGNLFNSEIYGNPTELPWGFIFVHDGNTVPHHPTQIYEALFYALLGVALMAIYRWRLDKIYRGTIFGIFFTFLFGFRFIVEFIKLPQEEFEKGMVLDMGQWLSIPFIVAGIAIWVWSYRKRLPSAIEKQVPARKKIQ